MSIGDKVVFSLLIIIITVLASAGFARSGEIGISSGPENLAYYASVENFKEACPQLDIHNFGSKGGISNLGNMSMRNEVPFGIAPLDALKYYEATNKGKASKIFVVAPLYKNGLQIIANVRSGIKNVKDIKPHHKGNRGPVGSGSWVAAQIVEIRSGLKYNFSVMSTSESLKKVMSGELDFAFYFSGVPTPDLVALGKEADGILRLVDMNDPNLVNFYEATQVPENTYAWERDAKTILQVQNYLLVWKGNEESAGQLAACLKDKADWLDKNGNAALKGMDLDAEVKWQWSPAAKQALGR